MNEYLISIVVCTYNRCSLLESAVKSLMQQTVSKNLYEVIVIDNNCTDDTKNVVEKLKSEYENLKYIIEGKTGLSNARNTGYINAQSAYIGYTDDDAKVSSNYVEQCLKIIDNYKPDIFGGPVYPFYEYEKPNWFKDIYGNMSCFEKSGWTTPEQYLSGPNIILRKNLLVECGGFDPNLGMDGYTSRYGEETQVVFWAHQHHKKIYYSTDLIVYHLVPKYKLNLLYHLKSGYESGRDYFFINDTSVKPLNEISLKGLTNHLINQIDTIYELVKEQYQKENLGTNLLKTQNFTIEKIVPILGDIGYHINKFKTLNCKKRSIIDKILDFNLRKLLIKFKNQ
jgi:glucosyl-dolichyl phosphate glucuronosyltransferase